jgi:tetratricopeptide (TPR) repeat protein
MIESRLRVMHLKIAQTLERREPTPSDTAVAELGRHYVLGKVPQKAWEYNRRAGETALHAHQLDAALHALERARRDLRLLPGNHTPQLARIDEQVGDIQRTRGNPDAAEESYVAALGGLPVKDRQARARVLLARATMARESARPSAAEGLGQEALEIATESGDLRGQAAAHRIRGRMAYEEGDYTTALDEAMVALDLLQRTEDKFALGECCTDIALAFSVMGPEVSDDAIRWYRRAVEILEGTEARYAYFRALANLGVALGRADPMEALEILAKARDAAQRIASPQGVARSLLLGIEFHLALGRIEAAERDFAQARRSIERIVDPRGVQLLSQSRGLLSERRGQWDEAAEAYRDAAERAGQLGLKAVAGECEFRLARLLFKTRDIPGARAALQRAEARNLARLRPSLVPALEELGRQLGIGPTASADPGQLGPPAVVLKGQAGPD